MWANPQFPADLVTFTEGILNGKPRSCAVFVKIVNDEEIYIFVVKYCILDVKKAHTQLFWFSISPMLD